VNEETLAYWGLSRQKQTNKQTDKQIKEVHTQILPQQLTFRRLTSTIVDVPHR